MKRSLALILALILAVFVLAACNEIEFEISFVVDGQVYDTIKTGGNEIISMPENPTKEGYTFGGWYWDKDVWEKPFTANSLLDAPLSSDMSVYAKWEEIPDSDEGGDQPSLHTCTLAYISSANATCTEYGNIEHLECTKCHKKFLFSNPSIELIDVRVPKLPHTLTHHARVEAGCATDGNIEYWHCSTCNKDYIDAIATQIASSTVIGKHGVTHHEKVEATCTTDGIIEYWHCSTCNKNYTDASATEIASSTVIEKHGLTHYARVAAGCATDGNIEYWHCSTCNKDYTDASATEIASSTVIEKARPYSSRKSRVYLYYRRQYRILALLGL